MQQMEYRLVELLVKFNLLICDLAFAWRRVQFLRRVQAAYSQQLVEAQCAWAHFARAQFGATYGFSRFVGALISPMLLVRTIRQRDQWRQELLAPRQTPLERDLRMQINTLEREIQGRQQEMESLRRRQGSMAVDIMSLVHQLFPSAKAGNATPHATPYADYEEFLRRIGVIARANRRVTAIYHPVRGWVWVYPEGPDMLTPAGLPLAQLWWLLPVC